MHGFQRRCIGLENAVIRASRRHPCAVGDHCLIGANAHVVGATLEGKVFAVTALPSSTAPGSGAVPRCVRMEKPLNFPDWVDGFARDTPDLMRAVTQRLSASLGAHAGDRLIDD